MEQNKSFGAGWLITLAVASLVMFGGDILDTDDSGRSTTITNDDATTYSRTADTTNKDIVVKQGVDDEGNPYGPYADYGDYGNIGYPEKNACNSTNYGYPDYIGTVNEGLTCADSYYGDYECIANPPYNYDGEIVIATSNPELSCCKLDGTCNWVGE